MKRILSIFVLIALTLTLALIFSISVSAQTEDSTPPTADESENADGASDVITAQDISEIIKNALADAGINSDSLDWRSYIEKQLIPAAVTAISAAAAYYVLALPSIRKIKNVLKIVKTGACLFEKAASDVSTTTEEKKKTESELAALKEDVAYIKSHIKTVEEIERIGFGNMKELVTGGIASEIGKVGHEDENKT